MENAVRLLNRVILNLKMQLVSPVINNSTLEFRNLCSPSANPCTSFHFTCIPRFSDSHISPIKQPALTMLGIPLAAASNIFTGMAPSLILPRFGLYIANITLASLSKSEIESWSNAPRMLKLISPPYSAFFSIVEITLDAGPSPAISKRGRSLLGMVNTASNNNCTLSVSLKRPRCATVHDSDLGNGSGIECIGRFSTTSDSKP